MRHTYVNREQKVARFHHAMNLDVDSDPRVSVLELRKKLLLEEVAEVSEAIDILSVELIRGKKGTKGQWANFLKELADVQYIVSGTFISFNTFPSDFDTPFNRVHSSNMSKLDNDGNPLYNKEGKVLKGPNYKEPDLTDLVKGSSL
jgi:predicted HAD superfamily Cof-like phosphohydrolase